MGIILCLSLALGLCSSLLPSFGLFLMTSLLLFFFLSTSSMLLALLQLLVYFGALIILFSYILMFCSFNTLSAPSHRYAFFFLFLIFSIGIVPTPCSLLPLLLSTSFLIFLGSILF